MTGARPDHLGDQTTSDLKKALESGCRVALLPVGSTEAHGPHLPLSTDVIIAQEISNRASAALASSGIVAQVLPALPYALTDFASEFEGTITVKSNTVALLLEEIASSLFGQGFSVLCLVNGHLEPEHARMLKKTAGKITEQGKGKCIFPDSRLPPTVEQLGEEFGRGGGHAGGYETSLVMAARPDLVCDDTRKKLAANFVDLAESIKDGAHTATEAGGDRCYFGDPAAASTDEGERLFSILSDLVAREVNEALL